VFILISQGQEYTSNLYDMYLDEFNCHTGEAKWRIPGFPLESIIIGLTFSIFIIYSFLECSTHLELSNSLY